MNEEDEIVKLVRDALEEEPLADSLKRIEEVAAVELKRRERRSFAFRGVGLLTAASLVLGLCLYLVLDRSCGREASGETREAICLICEFDGVDSATLNGLSETELLAAWQEAEL